MAAATTPAPSNKQMLQPNRPVARFPTTQPPSHKPAEFRKTQLHRQYQSMLRSSPLILMFQHNNLKATEWVGIQREIKAALLKVDEELEKTGNNVHTGTNAKLQVVQTGIFASALRVVEFWTPKFDETTTKASPEDYTHGLSVQAYRAGKDATAKHGLEALLSGPIAVLALPEVSTKHVKAALSILAPSKDIPAPKRRTNATYYDPAVQNGVQKMMLLGARIEGKAFDFEGARWVAGIEGGLEGLRGQLVALLSSTAASLTTTLESASRNLYLTMESRKSMLEEGEKEQ
ncbi:hypothetical protein AMS68_007896 [Peltaster fructicola]|uniref:Uncharacterized protein n=1 Tax=Peltaster fructicola TaxID=286661 RepID=A0A6H0Y6C9_9PEZI|nr:hypothetical protein AMS68_007896 [Peltaster fructicola]